jgi:hypothetical protein
LLTSLKVSKELIRVSHLLLMIRLTEVRILTKTLTRLSMRKTLKKVLKTLREAVM